MPAVVRGLVERRLPQLIIAGRAGDHRVPHAPAACRVEQPVTERAAFRLFSNRNGHLDDHARNSHSASMITAAGSEPGPGGVGPGAAIRAGSADSGGRGQGQHRMGLG